MGQQEIIEVLEKNKIPMTARQIALALEDTIVKVCDDLRKLLDYHEVQAIEIDRFVAREFFQVKHKMKIYYLDKKDLEKAKKFLPYL